MTANAPLDSLPLAASHHLRAMAQAAEAAAVGLRGAYRQRQSLRVSEKTAGDFVSEADQRAEAALSASLVGAYPAYGWVGEETGRRTGSDGAPYWIVDPLDGTTNFLKGIPHWAISIALAQGDEILAGLIYDPEKGELFSAEKGLGAWLNAEPISVSGETDLQAALFATGVPAGGRVTSLPDALRDLQRLMPKCAGIRRAGAAALDLAYVAAGRLEGYWERNLGPWDIAAGLLLVEEAGGRVDPLWPDRGILESGSFLASNGHMAGALRSNIE